MPRDRDGSFEPKIVKKRQKRLTGVDEMVISLAAKGLTTDEVQAHRHTRVAARRPVNMSHGPPEPADPTSADVAAGGSSVLEHRGHHLGQTPFESVAVREHYRCCVA